MGAEATMTNLARLFEQFRNKDSHDSKPVFWLGAGCSVHDGVPTNAALLSSILGTVSNAWGSDQFRFDRMLGGHAPVDRATLLRPMLERQLSNDSPYLQLVTLLQNGFVDTVFTFNIDDLLLQALRICQLTEHQDYVVIRVPEVNEQVSSTRLAAPSPRIKVVMLHGHYDYGFNYMTSGEIIEYNPEILNLVGRYSRRTAVVCGYSFFHLNVLNAFSRYGSPMFYVNPVFPDTPFVLSLMYARNTNIANFVDGNTGRFECFMTDMTRRLNVS